MSQKQRKTEIIRKKCRRLEHWEVITIFLVLYDIVVVNFSYFFALWMRFDFYISRIPSQLFIAWRRFTLIYTAICIVLFWFLRLYRSIWRFASYTELIRVFSSSMLTSVLHAVLITLFFQRMPVSYYIVGALIQFLLLLAIRFSYRLVLLLRNRRSGEATGGSRIMLIGAGAAGEMILRDMNHAVGRSGKVVCIIDDNPNKWNRYINNVPVVGGRYDIISNVEKYNIDKIFIAIPSASTAQRREILEICKETNCELKNLPSIEQLYKGEVTVAQLRSVSVEDLLEREPIHTDMGGVREQLRNKVILVTGAGGSIGSELCRQIAGYGPRQLILLDIFENGIYDIQTELREQYPKLKTAVLIGSVRDSRRMYELFEKYRPQIVYHAAAHKHVPLMEDSPNEAVKNNAIGTFKTAYAAMVHGCERFVLISTDKAVNPTNVMGATKRICEMIVQSFDAKVKEGKAGEIPQLFTHEGEENADRDGSGEIFRHVKTEFVAVRFGNVLGSNGSVIPLFRHQIAKGGPVTVTHPEIIRYFMTIAEAVSLVLLAGTYAKGGEIFVLDMGSPVKIDTLARNMIRLAGLKPDVDIPIKYVGLRPGEKLYEEKLMAEEGITTTANEKIFVGKPLVFDVDEFFKKLETLMNAAYANKETIPELVKEIVPTYRPEENGMTANV